MFKIYCNILTSSPFLKNKSIKFDFSSSEPTRIWTQSVFQNYPEGLQCVLASQKEIEEVMSLYFKPYYPGVFAATQPNYAWLPYSLVKWRMRWMRYSPLSPLPPLWLAKTTPLRRWKQLIWQENELNEIKFSVSRRDYFMICVGRI